MFSVSKTFRDLPKNPVPNNQGLWKPDQNGKLYRVDCSGMVSMAWKLDKSRVVSRGQFTLTQISKKINKNDLKAGDVLIHLGEHVLLFEKWADAGKNFYWAYEQHGPNGTPTKHWKVPYPYFKNKNLYTPWRYNGIQD